MALLCFKIIACSSLLFLFFQLFLAREKTFTFNRFFLLSSLLFAYSIPFIAFNLPTFQKAKSNLLFGEIVPTVQQTPISNPSNFDVENILMVIYVLVSFFFLLKFVYSLTKILLLKGEDKIYKNQKIKIIERNAAPFSFLNTIYIGKKYWKINQIDERIFLHESFHVVEKHSIDILLLEILKIFSWFNPVLFLYKKAIINNHEFMADDYVLCHHFDLRNYQYLILNEINCTQILTLTHQFNFNETKKRFIMMTTKTSKFSNMKKVSLLPVIGILFVLFAKNVSAQNAIEKTETATHFKSEIEKVAPPVTEIYASNNLQQRATKDEKGIETLQTKVDTIKKNTVEEVATPILPPAKPFDDVDVLPSYPGGINEFRTLVNNNFNTSIFTGGEGLMKTTIHFTIDENGKTSNFGTEGNDEKFNQEALRAVEIANQEKLWKPAIKNGKNVKYIFKMPLTIHFTK